MEVIHYPVSLDLSIGDFFKKVLREESLFPPPQHTLSLSLLEKFQAAGCDYYELTAIATAMVSFSEIEVGTLISLSPESKAILPATWKNIRESIPRWTSSKYHSAPIAKVVENVHNLLTENRNGIKVYNSNLNLRNKRASNDQYILLISGERRIFLDINRRATITFSME